MKKQTSHNFSSASTPPPGSLKPAANRAPKPESKTRRYVYTEQDLGHERLHMGITAATYAALSATF